MQLGKTTTPTTTKTGLEIACHDTNTGDILSSFLGPSMANDDRTNVRFLLAVQTSLKELGTRLGPLNNQSYYCYLDYEYSLASGKNKR